MGGMRLGSSYAWKRPALWSLSYPSVCSLLSLASLKAGDLGGIPHCRLRPRPGGLWGLGYGSSQCLGGLRRLLRTSF